MGGDILLLLIMKLNTNVNINININIKLGINVKSSISKDSTIHRILKLVVQVNPYNL